MIPVSLTIEGLYSYQEPQKINFSELGKAHLFGIFGQVGSGKSTILEAISFALYGKTDRLTTADKRNYNMMNLKSDKMFISFEFTAGENGSLYIAEASSKRNKKKFSDVNVIERKAYKLENGERTPIEVTALEEAVGLSYENFKRTIIIPQGKFQEFLQLSSKDRTQMMKELFGLGKFELSQNVSSLESENNAKKQNIEGQLQQLGNISHEEIEQIAQKVLALETKIIEITIQLKKKHEEEIEVTRIKNLIIKKEELEKQKKELIEKKTQITKREEIISKYEYCLQHFQGLFELKKSGAEKILSLGKSLEINKKEQSDFLNKIELAKKLHSEIQPAYDARESELKKADELSKLKTVSGLINEINALETRLKNGEDKLKENEKTAAEFKEKQESTTKTIAEIKKNMPDLAELSLINAWHIENKNLTEGLKKNQESIKNHEIVFSDIKSAVLNIIPEAVISNASELTTLIDERITTSNTDLEKINGEIDELNIRAKLLEFSDSLKDGHACPLCGSTHHPSKYKNKEIAEQLDSFKKLKSKEENQIKKLSELRQKLDGNIENIEKAINEKSRQENLIDLHLKKFKWPEYENSDESDKAFELAKKLSEKLKNEEDIIAKVNDALNIESANREKYIAALAQINNDKTNKCAQKDLLLSQIMQLCPDDFINMEPEKIEALISSMKKTISETIAKYEKITQELANLQKSSDELTGSINSEEKLLAEENSKLLSLNEKISIKIADSPFSNPTEIEEILERSMNTEKEKKDISDFYLQFKSVNDQFDNILTEIGNKTYSPENHKILTEEIQTLQHSKSLTDQEKGETTAILKRMNEDALKKIALNKELTEVIERGDDLKTLKKLFHASGFVNFVSTAYLRNLCTAANIRFYKMTGQKLSLELSEDNDFLVRDFLNGGNLRSIKTLSGGQTFQAALSMALALADNIQNLQNSSQNFFFLDEGFGTLDKNSILTVFETLKSLKKENRVVGVISHVEELQHDIEMNLKIVNDEERGSLITKSWG
ncbi:MAG: hypothetical protein A2W91_10590 [Bacteroidetes bacterium GWF2_38_335]|nr:MAG: hypothetical protein A2W91_10590 [Bacteroidetes bacterium GWF2_38_335]OFY81849.1 MAG: hypothetical protein A2281_06450 [Bacteroidetes bacterium RIFOXYA12_FULL_38_20]HBS87925.1 hypothetical protein [Bacteroidales bacterium]